MTKDEDDEYVYKINEENDELKNERINALRLIIETFEENLSKSEKEIKVYSPYKHKEIKIINADIIK